MFWKILVVAFYLTCICTKNVWAQTVPLIYGIQTTPDSFLIKAIDLVDNGSFESDLVTIDRLPGERVLDIVQLTTSDVALIMVIPGEQMVIANITNPTVVDAVTSVVPKEVPLGGLPQGIVFHHAIALNNNTLIGLTSDIVDTPPFTLVSLNLKSGKVKELKTYSLVPDQRIGNFTRCSDKTIYATIHSGREGGSLLVKMNANNRKFAEVAKLQVGDARLTNDVISLACSPSGELYALANPAYEATNSLYQLNPIDGRLTLLRKFDVEKITSNISVPDQPLSAITGKE